MLINYLRTALRRLWKNKGFFTLNFVGLYISVSAALLIALLIMYESSFDRGVSTRGNATGGTATTANTPAGDLQVYRIVNQSKSPQGADYTAVTPYPLATALRVAMPDQPYISQIHWERETSVLVGTTVLKEKNVAFADSVFPRLFNVQVQEGSLTRALANVGLVALTQSTAERYFGHANAIGKRIRIGNTLELEVAAVIADPPPNTHLPYHILAGYPSLTGDFIGGFSLGEWTLNANGYTYIGFPKASNGATPGAGADSQAALGVGGYNEQGSHDVKGGGILARTELTMADLIKKNITPHDLSSDNHYYLQPLSAIHYDLHYTASNPTYTINSSYLTLIGAIGLFLILAACINYTNLSTAMALKKGKEVGVRKTLGATRGQLVRQLLSETFLLTAIVITVAAATAGFFLPLVNNLLDKNIPTNWIGLTSAVLLLVLWVVVSLLSGIYPALVLSRFRPVAALKSMASTPRASVLLLRRGLVLFQFVTAQMLIICAIVVSKQMAFVRDTPLGFNKNLVVDVLLPDNKPEHISAFRARLQDIPGVARFTFDLAAPISDNNNVSTGFARKEDMSNTRHDVEIKAADHNYLDVYGLKMAAGRWINEADERDVARSVPDSLRHYAFVLNETAVKALGYRSPEEAIGKQVRFNINQIVAPIVGVVRDYHIANLHKPVSPVIMVAFPYFYYDAGIRLSGTYHPTTMAAIEKAYNEVYPQQLYEAKFVDATIEAQYKEEGRTQQLFNLFTGLSIAINVLGLVGLLAFMIEQRTKEVGIRKVLGAGVADISLLLSKDFLRLIGIAFLVAAPLAGLLMNKWLQDFAYRTQISWWVFVGALVATVVVTCVAISFQTIRAAIVNPAKSLKSE
jgi:ABC-type antimicrobial peptide transport system permease subunit